MALPAMVSLASQANAAASTQSGSRPYLAVVDTLHRCRCARNLFIRWRFFAPPPQINTRTLSAAWSRTALPIALAVNSASVACTSCRRGDRSSLLISTSTQAEEISRPDVERVNEVATAISLGQDRELLHYIPQEYRVDDQDGISDPKGMTGLRLEVQMYLVSVQTAAAQNLRKSVERAGYRVSRLVLEPLAASLAVLTEEERELGCALVDLGGGSTGVAIFKDGKVQHIASLPYAGSHVTGDIVQGLSVTQADAERLKEKWGTAYAPLVDPDESIGLPSTPGQGVRQAKRELLAHIIHQRLDEILGLVNGEIEKTGFTGNLPAGVVVTGGGAHQPGIVELAREVFATPARVGMPKRGISGLVDSVQAPRYAVAAGLLLYAARNILESEAAKQSGVGKFFGPMKRWLQDFF